jgi:hypothetical protein
VVAASALLAGSLLVVGAATIALAASRDEHVSPTSSPPVEALPAPPVAEVQAPLPPKVAEPPPAPPAESPTFGCNGERGEILGYWYAGVESPGAEYRLPTDARVRADYPRRANGHETRAREQCVLPRGTTVRPQNPPIHGDGDRWWVPFTAGDAVPT